MVELPPLPLKCPLVIKIFEHVALSQPDPANADIDMLNKSEIDHCKKVRPESPVPTFLGRIERGIS